MARQLLIDNFSFVPLKMLTESEAGDKYVFEGVFGHVDRPTSNGRIYTRDLIQREITRLEDKMSVGKVFGELDHPDDGKTKLQRCAVLVQSLKINEQGQVLGKMKIMNTSMGKELKAIVDAGGQIGVSSRGYGSVQTNEDGLNVVQDDFKLMTYDPVADPAEESAYPELQKSKTESASSTDVKNVSPDKNEPSAGSDEDSDDTKDDATDDVKDAPPGNVSTSEHVHPDSDDEGGSDDEKAKKVLFGKSEKKEDYDLDPAGIVDQFEKNMESEVQAKVEAALAEQRKEFEASLVVAVKKAKERVKAEVVKEMMADPSVAGAKSALAEVKTILAPHVLSEDVSKVLTEKDGKIANLVERLKIHEKTILEEKQKSSCMTKAAKEMGYNLYIERNLAVHPKLDQIVESLGEFSNIPTLADLKKKLAPYVEQAGEMIEAKEKRIKDLKESVELMTERYQACKAELIEQVTENQEHKASIYLERKITGNPYQVEIREEFDRLEKKSKDNIDHIIEGFNNQRRSDNRDFVSVRKRIEKQRGGFRTETLVEDHVEETFPSNHKGNAKMQVMGESFDMAEVNRLAGLK